jgi:hypothetical protein
MHQVSHELYLLQTAQQHLSPFVYVRGFRIEMAYGDMMHDLFIGAGLHHCASHIVKMCELGLVQDVDGNNITDVDDALEILTIRLRNWCKANLVRYPPHRLTRSALNRKTKTTFPELSTTWKAAHVKVLIKWLASDAPNIYTAETPDVDLLITNAWSLAHFVDILDKAGCWLTSDEVTQAQEAGKLWLQSYKSLALRAMEVFF